MQVLLLMTLIGGSFAGMRWFQPTWLEWVAAKCLARAAAIRESRKVYAVAFAHYEKELIKEA